MIFFGRQRTTTGSRLLRIYSFRPGHLAPMLALSDRPRVSDPLFPPDGIFCDPQLGCSDRLVAQDLSDEHAWQLSQEFRVASNFSGPLNFSAGGNYLHYETEEDYYVFFNSITAFAAVPAYGNLDLLPPWQAGVSDNHQCLGSYGGSYAYPRTNTEGAILGCGYIDPNPITNLNSGQGHNYFRSENPYLLDSYAAFGELHYSLANDLKLTGGMRWTDDRKHFIDIPSELLVPGYGYPATAVVDQQWKGTHWQSGGGLDADAGVHRSNLWSTVRMHMVTKQEEPIHQGPHFLQGFLLLL